METKPASPTPNMQPPKRVDDVTPPLTNQSAAPLPQNQRTVQVPVRPVPSGSPLTIPPANPAGATPLPSKPQALPKQKAPVGIVIMTILVTLALCALAVLAYMHDKSKA